MANDAQNLLKQIQEATGQFGITISAQRIVQAATPLPKNVFGNSPNATTATITATAIIDSLKEKLVPTLAGAKNMEILKMMLAPGTFIMNDEITYAGHTYIVDHIEPVPFMGTNLVEFVNASREVD